MPCGPIIPNKGFLWGCPIKKSLLICGLVFFWLHGKALGEFRLSDVDVRLGGQIYYHHYREPGIMETQGPFRGLTYSFFYGNRIALGLEGMIASGSVDYSSRDTGKMDGNDDFCTDTRLLIFYGSGEFGRVKIRPYFGFAYRFLEDNSQGKASTTGHMGYLRQSNYYYTPIGLRMRRPYLRYDLIFDFEYDLFWTGRQESYLGSIAGYDDIENDQDLGFGVRGSLGIEKQVSMWIWRAQVFFRYWYIDTSDVTRDSAGRFWVEPANNTRELGFHFSIGF